eukprot:scaffold1.g5351.t1
MAARGGALARAFEPLVAWLAPRYQAVVGKELRKYGLRYEDLYDPQLDMASALCDMQNVSNADVDEALKRLPQDVVDARNQRLKRAHDINMKHSALPKELQACARTRLPWPASSRGEAAARRRRR